ncbi:hypothetical protein [Micromonospora sp. PLK6-60]|uniref:hypothetical protein n=1 Tax=Micromonospora sp. PLK6-60 TaxID=2873383 RepID=UPI0021067C87|nr:hypothetical protein [Micromonospora sp. PLK6-60]
MATARVLELRVHGVSNTPPQQLLGLRPEPDGTGPRPWLVAGGEVTGFYRSTTARPHDPVTVEAYSWGQLTSGARTARDVERALWTLLLPFTLANVALYARPGIPAEPDQERWGSRSGLAAWLIRLFCLSLTGTLVLTVTGIGVDLVGWQCVDRDCLARMPGPWEFLAEGWWREDARALAAGLLLPLALLVLLGLMAWRTYQYEAEMPADPCPGPAPRDRRAGGATRDPAAGAASRGGESRCGPHGEPDEPDEPAPPRNPLQDPTFWCGEGQLRRAGVLHLCTGAVVAAAVPLVAVLRMDPPHGLRSALAWPTVTAIGAVLVIAVVAAGRPYLSRRAGYTPLGPWSVAVAVLTGLGLAGTFLILLLPDGPAGVPLTELRPPPGCVRDAAVPGCRADRSLPGYDAIFAWLAVYQVLLLIAIGAVARSGRRALVPPALGGALLPLARAWVDGSLPGAPSAPAALSIWMLTGPAIALAGTGLLLPRAHPDADRHPDGPDRADPHPGKPDQADRHPGGPDQNGPGPGGPQPGGPDRERPTADRETAVREAADPGTDVAWGGRGPALIAGAGWLMAVAYCAGLLYWVAARLDGAVRPGGTSPVTLPQPVIWAGLAFVVALAVLGCTLLGAGIVFQVLRHREYARLTRPGTGLSAHDLRRCRDVSRFRALHRLVGDHAIRLIGCYAAATAALVTLSCAAALSHTDLAAGHRGALDRIAGVGDALLGWLPVVVAGVGMLVYRNDTVRRTVGVFWDVGTFWPRAAHPLAPPSYAERAVPELQTRVAGLLALDRADPRRVDGVILSGHSQGTVICASVLLQLPPRWRRRTWFFSYGCQLTRLYGRVFPAYFGPERLRALAVALTPPGGPVAWSNFWRHTDPLGWPVDAGERDVPVADPEALHPSAGEVADPPIRNHGSYPEAREFLRERAAVARLLRRPVPSPRQRVS